MTTNTIDMERVARRAAYIIEQRYGVNRVLVQLGKHDPTLYLIATPEQYRKVAVDLVETFNSMEFYGYWPEEPEPRLTEAEIDALPTYLQRAAQSAVRTHAERQRAYEKGRREKQLLERALEGDSDAAVLLIEERRTAEYEGFYITEIHDL